MKAEPRRRKRAKIALTIAVILMSILGVSLIAANLTGTAKLAAVMSDSMQPGVPKGSLIVLQTEEPSSVSEGDIVALGVGTLNKTQISRISSISSDSGVYSYTLWADNAQIQDPWLHRTISDMQIMVWSAPYLGWLFLIVSNPFFVIAMLIASVVMARYYTMKIFEYNKRQVNARRIAEERLENIKYGGVNDVITMFEDEERGGVMVKIGKQKPVKVQDVDSLNDAVIEYEKTVEEKLHKKNAKRTKVKQVSNDK